MSACKAECHIGDDYADGRATMSCELEEGHEGPHIERFRTEFGDVDGSSHNVRLEWEGDDRDVVEIAIRV